jgi:Icc-related predicted phosphoesterase
VIRIAAVGDVHFGADAAGTLRPHLEQLPESADVLLLAGDFTRHGDAAEAAVLAAELRGIDVPMFGVLGNHDHHADQADEVRAVLADAGVRMLEGETATVDVDGERLAIAGSKGFGGGFAGACGSDFGEPEMKAFIRHTKQVASRLDEAVASLDGDVRVVLMHYAPIPETLQGERLEIYPFLGSYLLGEAVDRHGADLIVHGHAHRGTEKGVTPGGVRVRNVAQPLIRRAYNLYCFGTPAGGDDAPGVGGRAAQLA